MLVLTRRGGETLKIGDDISITILRIKGNQVRLGLAAPRGVPVRRSELAPRASTPRDTAPGAAAAPGAADATPKATRTRSGLR